MSAEPPLLRLFASLPRQGPGSRAATLEALGRLGRLPVRPRVIDLGCGSGSATLVLAETLGSRILAVDREPRLLARLEAAAEAEGLGDLVETRRLDLGALDLPDGAFDLLWSEGAIYNLGFEAGLRRWRPLLAAGGRAAISEIAWLGDDPPPAVAAFWREAYPFMAGIATNAARAARAGFAVLDRFVLPEAAWWDDFYRPLLDRLDALEATGDPDLQDLISSHRREVDLYRRYHAHYGYVFWLLRRSD